MNLQGVPLLDSAGLELLVETHIRCGTRGGGLQLAATNSLCREILTATGLASRFALFDSVTAAVGSYAQ